MASSASIYVYKYIDTLDKRSIYRALLKFHLTRSSDFLERFQVNFIWVFFFAAIMRYHLTFISTPTLCTFNDEYTYHFEFSNNNRRSPLPPKINSDSNREYSFNVLLPSHNLYTISDTSLII